MLLDLDDTLFDCAGTLVPAAHRDAVVAMVAAGLPGPAEARLAELHAILATTPGSAAYAHLTARHGIRGPAVASAGSRAFHTREIPPLDPFPGVRETLDAWAGRIRRVLVTRGDPPTQRRKVERLALKPHVDTIEYVALDAAGGKQAAFAQVLAKASLAPAAVLVVGNRRDDEIAAGRRLGCRTVLVRGGEYAVRAPAGPDELPDAEIDGFVDLGPLVSA